MKNEFSGRQLQLGGLAFLWVLFIGFLLYPGRVVYPDSTLDNDTIPTRTPTATPVSQQFIPVVENDWQYTPPPFFSLVWYHPDYGHSDGLTCGEHYMYGFVYDKNGNYLENGNLAVQITAEDFDVIIPVSNEQDYGVPAWGLDLPSASWQYKVQLLKSDHTFASWGYYVLPNQDCYWNLIRMSFIQVE